MSNIEPRWGGSLKEMDGFASQASVELKNPRDAAMVLARPPAYRAQERAQADDWNGALRYYDESLKLHQDASVLCERSFALSTLKRHDEAFADVKSALATGRATPYCLDRAVSAGLNANDPNEVVALLDLVLKADPGLVPALNQRAWALQQTGKLDLAFRELLASAKQGDGWAQMEVGTWYQEGKGVKRDYEQSLIWLAKAAEQNVPDADQRMQMVRKQAGK